MAVDLAKYVVSLEAETAKYTQQLQAANGKLEQFERRNTESLKRLDRGFTDMSNRFTLVAAKLRSVFSLFGVAFGVRAFAGWISDAIEVEKLTDKQKVAIEGASKALKDLNAGFGDVARTVATELAPSLEHAAKFWKEFFFPTGSQFGKPADAIREQVDAQLAEVNRLQRLLTTQTSFDANANWLQRLIFGDHADNITETTGQLAAARAELEKLRDAWQGAMGGNYRSQFQFEQGPDKSQLEFMQKVRDQDAKALQDRDKTIARGQDLSPEIRTYVEHLEAAEKLTASMRTDVEEQIDAWRDAKQLFDAGLISPETLNRLDQQQLQPIEVTAKKIKNTFEGMNKDAKRFAMSMGQNLKDSFDDWILGADRNFSDLLKRMAVKMATSSIFKGFASLFPGGSFFSEFFGGAFAGGGRPPMGKASLVGEHGPELIVPRGASTIIPNGAGGSISIVNHIDARGADSSLIARLPMILNENNQRLKAEIRHEQSRRR